MQKRGHHPTPAMATPLCSVWPHMTHLCTSPPGLAHVQHLRGHSAAVSAEVVFSQLSVARRTCKPHTQATHTHTHELEYTLDFLPKRPGIRGEEQIPVKTANAGYKSPDVRWKGGDEKAIYLNVDESKRQT